jgi:hypothetical protein
MSIVPPYIPMAACRRVWSAAGLRALGCGRPHLPANAARCRYGPLCPHHRRDAGTHLYAAKARSSLPCRTGRSSCACHCRRCCSPSLLAAQSSAVRAHHRRSRCQARFRSRTQSRVADQSASAPSRVRTRLLINCQLRPIAGDDPPVGSHGAVREVPRGIAADERIAVGVRRALSYDQSLVLIGWPQ